MLLSPPATDGSYSFNIPLSAIPAGADTLFIRVQDSTEGKWSITAIQNLSVALPLTLLNFNVVKQNNTAKLTWQTTNEINTAYFNVQRSTDGRGFSTVGKVTAKNSAGNNGYAFTDDISQLSADKIYYRLQMTDKDGKFNYSSIRNIDILKAFSVAVIPNPVVGSNVILHIFSPANAKLQLAVYDASGKAIFNEQFNMPSGSLYKIINHPGLASGSYLVRITDGTSIQTIKFIKQ